MPARRPLLLAVLLAAALAAAPAMSAGGRDKKKEKDEQAHHFAVVGHRAAIDGEAALKEVLDNAKDEDLAFLVVTGIKGPQEPCGDRVFQKRRDLFDKASRPVIVSLTGSDWTGCRNSLGRTNAIERLNRLRELFYGEPESLGKERLPLTRLSSSPRFRSYAENTHWQVDKVLYATINLPAANNHYLPAAGRNSEYEDRAVANRFWLNRLFALARRTRLEAVVLFSEGDIKALTEPPGLLARLGRGSPATQDGYAATRRQVLGLAEKFSGKVLLIDSAEAIGAVPKIEWRENLGHVSVGSGTYHIKVAPDSAKIFTLEEP